MSILKQTAILSVASLSSFSVAFADTALAEPTVPKPFINQRVCPVEFPALTAAIAKDLPNYLTRTYTRLKFKTQVIAVSVPELEPLPLAAGAIATNQPINPATDPRQMFVKVRERSAGNLEATDKSYWLFLSHTRRGWRLAMAFTRINNAPPEDVSDGAIATAVRTWLRDYCGSL